MDQVIILYLAVNHWILIFVRLDRQHRTWTAFLFDSAGTNTPSIHKARNFIAGLTRNRIATKGLYYRWPEITVEQIAVPNTSASKMDSTVVSIPCV